MNMGAVGELATEEKTFLSWTEAYIFLFLQTDQQHVFYNENILCAKKIQRICVAEAETPK